MITADPIAIPVTRPPAETEAIPGAPELHTPPGVASESDDVCPTQMVVLPLIAAITVAAFTVITTVAETGPQLLVTV